MAQNQALIIANLSDVLYSEEEIIKSVERVHIFEIKDKEENSLGFISSFDLKAYVLDQSIENFDYEIKNIDSNDWSSLFTHPSFQRRRPQLVPLSNLVEENDQQYFILKNGQKDGPYEKYELLSMLEQKELLLTDMVTTNGGLTWIKLFHVDNFERRVLKESDQLPSLPNQAVMTNNESVASSIPSTEAIGSLAYLSNVKRGKTIERERDESYKAESSRQKSSSIYKWLLAGSIIGIAYFGYQIKDQLRSPFSNEGVRIGEQAEMLTPVEINDGNKSPRQVKPAPRETIEEKRGLNQINDTQRNPGKFQPRELKPIKPTVKKSFMDTSSYQDTTNISESEDPNYYYDNTSPMELDPVRSQVSKENYDNSAAEGDGRIPSGDNLFDNEIPASSN